MLLSLRKEFEAIHTGDILEACLEKGSGALNRSGYSCCVFAVVSFTETTTSALK